MAAVCGDPRRCSLKGVELHFVIMLARVQAIEVAAAVDAKQHRFAIQHFSAASTISGNRSLQSWPLRVNSRTRFSSR
jgi:hypothetical protein